MKTTFLIEYAQKIAFLTSKNQKVVYIYQDFSSIFALFFRRLFRGTGSIQLTEGNRFPHK